MRNAGAASAPERPSQQGTPAAAALAPALRPQGEAAVENGRSDSAAGATKAVVHSATGTLQQPRASRLRGAVHKTVVRKRVAAGAFTIADALAAMGMDRLEEDVEDAEDEAA